MRPPWFNRWLTGMKWQTKAWDLKCQWDRFGAPKEWQGRVGDWNCDERRDAIKALMEKEGLIIGEDFVNCMVTVRYWDETNSVWKVSGHTFLELYGTNAKDRKGNQVLNGYKIDAAAPNATIIKFWKGPYNDRT